jgi:hypothetical protein
MAVVEIPREGTGWLAVEDAAEHHGCDARAVQRWIAAGLLPALVIGSGNRTVYLLRRRDVVAFRRPARGRPTTAS